MKRPMIWMGIMIVLGLFSACGVKSPPLPPLNEQPVDSERDRVASPSPSPKS